MQQSDVYRPIAFRKRRNGQALGQFVDTFGRDQLRDQGPGVRNQGVARILDLVKSVLSQCGVLTFGAFLFRRLYFTLGLAVLCH